MPSKLSRIRKLVRKATPPITPRLMRAFGTMHGVHSEQGHVRVARQDLHTEERFARTNWANYLNQRRIKGDTKNFPQFHDLSSRRTIVKVGEQKVGRAQLRLEQAENRLNSAAYSAKLRRDMIKRFHAVSLLNPRTAYRWVRRKARKFSSKK